MPSPREIIRVIGSHRYDLADEAVCQAQMAEALTAAGVQHQREVVIGPGERIDFMIGDVGVEVKLRGGKRAIHGQCQRYCRCAAVKALILTSNRTLGLPAEMEGKPVHFLHLGRAWL